MGNQLLGQSHDFKTSRSIEKEARHLEKISGRLLLYLVAMTSFTLVEGLIGLSHKNVHVLRDFFNFSILVLTLAFSTRAIDIWNESQQE